MLYENVSERYRSAHTVLYIIIHVQQKGRFSNAVNWALLANHCKIDSCITFHYLSYVGSVWLNDGHFMDTVWQWENLRNLREPRLRNSEWFHSVATILSLSVHITLTYSRCQKSYRFIMVLRSLYFAMMCYVHSKHMYASSMKVYASTSTQTLRSNNKECN